MPHQSSDPGYLLFIVPPVVGIVCLAILAIPFWIAYRRGRSLFVVFLLFFLIPFVGYFISLWYALQYGGAVNQCPSCKGHKWKKIDGHMVKCRKCGYEQTDPAEKEKVETKIANLKAKAESKQIYEKAKNIVMNMGQGGMTSYGYGEYKDDFLAIKSDECNIHIYSNDKATNRDVEVFHKHCSTSDGWEREETYVTHSGTESVIGKRTVYEGISSDIYISIYLPGEWEAHFEKLFTKARKNPRPIGQSTATVDHQKWENKKEKWGI